MATFALIIWASWMEIFITTLYCASIHVFYIPVVLHVQTFFVNYFAAILTTRTLRSCVKMHLEDAEVKTMCFWNWKRVAFALRQINSCVSRLCRHQWAFFVAALDCKPFWLLWHLWFMLSCTWKIQHRSTKWRAGNQQRSQSFKQTLSFLDRHIFFFEGRWKTKLSNSVLTAAEFQGVFENSIWLSHLFFWTSPKGFALVFMFWKEKNKIN